MGQRKRLSAILIAGYLCNNLCGNVTGSKKAVWLLNHSLTDDSTILKHVFQIQQIAVMLFLSKIIRIMKMNNTFLMCFHNVFRKQNTAGQVLADFTSHIISLSRVDHRVLIGILLLDFFVHVVNQCQNTIVSGITFPGKLSLVAVADILLCYLVPTHLHDTGLHHILDIFHIHRMGHPMNLL